MSSKKQHQTWRREASIILRQYGHQAKGLYSDIVSSYLIRQKIPDAGNHPKVGILYLNSEIDQLSDSENYTWIIFNFGILEFSPPVCRKNKYIFVQLSVQADQFEELKLNANFNSLYTIVEKIC